MYEFFPDTIADVEKRLDQLNGYCGCTEASLTAVLGCLFWLGYAGNKLSIIAVAGWAVLVFFASGLVGKLIVLGIAGIYRRQLTVHLQVLMVDFMRKEAK
jgi:hypothetical protein